jgi:hypothetical protein
METAMVKVVFLKDELYEYEGRNQGHLYRKGEQYRFDRLFADRWVRRGLAEVIGEEDKPASLDERFTPLNKVAGAADDDESPAAKRHKAGQGKKAAPKPKAPPKPESAPKPPETASDPAPAATEPAATPPASPAPAELPGLAPPKPGDAG